jgi:hypothetical protein
MQNHWWKKMSQAKEVMPFSQRQWLASWQRHHLAAVSVLWAVHSWWLRRACLAVAPPRLQCGHQATKRMDLRLH